MRSSRRRIRRGMRRRRGVRRGRRLNVFKRRIGTRM